MSRTGAGASAAGGASATASATGWETQVAGLGGQLGRSVAVATEGPDHGQHQQADDGDEHDGVAAAMAARLAEVDEPPKGSS